MMQVSRYISFFLLALTFCLASCSFNRLFLQPDTYPPGFKGVTIHTKDDTLKAFFTGKNHQPVFTKRNGRDTVTLDFTIESIVFLNAAGDSLNGWFLKPRGQAPSATIIHMHGNGGSLLSQYKAISPLIKNGFQIFIFDYSGFGFSTGKPTRKNALKDALAAMDYIKTRADVKGTRLVIYGQSFGGHLAAVVAEQRQQDIDALVVEGAFSSAKDIAAERVPVIGRIFTKQGYSAVRSIKNYHKPVLIIHSTEDKLIPFYMGQKLYKAANAPKEFYEIQHCHICGPTYYPDEIAGKIKQMIN